MIWKKNSEKKVSDCWHKFPCFLVSWCYFQILQWKLRVSTSLDFLFLFFSWFRKFGLHFLILSWYLGKFWKSFFVHFWCKNEGKSNYLQIIFVLVSEIFIFLVWSYIFSGGTKVYIIFPLSWSLSGAFCSFHSLKLCSIGILFAWF